MIRTHKAQKKRYRFEINHGVCKLQKEYFEDWGDSRATNRWEYRLHKLVPGSTIILSCWDRRIREWVILCRGGKES